MVSPRIREHEQQYLQFFVEVQITQLIVFVCTNFSELKTLRNLAVFREEVRVFLFRVNLEFEGEEVQIQFVDSEHTAEHIAMQE